MSENDIAKIFEISKFHYSEDSCVLENMTKKEFDKKFLKALNSLSEKFSLFLTKTFLDGNRFWWVDYYSKSAYYENLKKAKNTFLLVFNSEI